MKRLLLSGAFFLCSFLTAFAQFSGSGNGTESDPYLIFNETQLSQMANFLGQEGVVFKLQKDLDLTDWIAENNPSQGWLSVGVQSSPFMGVFHGNGHKITGLTISRSKQDNVGFFGYVDGLSIDNLTLEANDITGNANVAVLCGYASATTISNCVISQADGATVTAQSGNVGGLLGQSSSSSIASCTLKANVQGASGSVGGLIGDAANTNISGCTITADISSSASYTGGLAGSYSSTSATTVSACRISASVSGGQNTGGIVGISHGVGTKTFCDLRHTGDISGTTQVGGVVGCLQDGQLTLTSCHSKGVITASGAYTGGVIGLSRGGQIESMESCSHFGDITGTTYVGGVIGAFINVTDSPLATWTVYSGCTEVNGVKVPSGSLSGTYTESSVSSGSAKDIAISNCASIGNIKGSKYIGGLVGFDQAAYGYEIASTGVFSYYDGYTNTWYSYFSDGNYNGTYKGRHYFGNTYTRNTTSLAISNSYYSGTIKGSDCVGGIAGYKSGGVLQNNFAYATVVGDSNVGGILGQSAAEKLDNAYNTTTLKSNVAIATTVSATKENVGRIYGKVEDAYTTLGALASTEGNRALATTSVIQTGIVQEISDDNQNGSSIGISALKLKANYVAFGWSFDENWDILETECFPYKKYQAAPPVIESDLVSQATTISGKSLDGGTVYLYYKDRDAVSTQCDGNSWSFSTEALQSGAQLQIYADVDDMTPSYFTTTTVKYPGSGTEDDPYRIYTAEDLQGASNRGYYKLMNDIDLTSWINENSPTTGWVAIGRNSGEATYIDGDGHKVSGLWINSTEDYTGLFSNFSAGQIKNLNVEVASGKSVKGGDYTGVLIGRNANGKIVNCSVKGDVEGTCHVGGVVGTAEATTLTSLTYDGKATVTSSNAWLGGIVGLASATTIANCNTAATLTATTSSISAGGIAGEMSGEGSITKSVSNNSIALTGSNCNVGGIAGYISSSSPITLCVANGTISSTGSGENSYTGGIVGLTKASVANSYSTATISGGQFSAGVVGYTYSTIDKCYAKGDIKGVTYGGGVVGELDGSAAALTNSVAASNVLSLTAQSSWGSRVIGGYKNGASDPDESNYALSTMQVSLNNVPQKKTDDIVEGIAKTEAELMLSATYSNNLGWDFTSVWGIDEGEMYPYLLWEVDVNPVADITLDKTTLLIAAGKTETLSASVLPLGATNKRLKWTSDNESVATVEDGTVTAVAVGTATITATSTDGSNVSATCKVTVVANKDAAVSELQSLVDKAQNLYDNSSEGTEIGQYASGSRSELLAVIKEVKAKISSTMSDDDLTDCTTKISEAIETFNSKKVSAGEDTDVTAYDNVIFIENTKAGVGSQVTLSVKMNNTMKVQGLQYDAYLPDGITFVQNDDESYKADLSLARTTANKMTWFSPTLQTSGALRMMAASITGYTFDGNEGEVATIVVDVPSGLEAGDYPIILKDLVMSSPDGEVVEVPYVKSTLTVSSYTLGDVNNDGKINVADITVLSNKVMGGSPAVFNEQAADINKDSKLNVGDVTALSNIILKSQAAKVKAKKLAMAPIQHAASNTDISQYEDVAYVESQSTEAGERCTLSVKMNNKHVMCAYQFDIELPEGMSFAKNEDDSYVSSISSERLKANDSHVYLTGLQNDGKLRVLCYTTNPAANVFQGESGEIATFTINVDRSVDVGEYPIKLSGIVLSAPDNEVYYVDDEVESILTITGTAFDGVVLDENSTTAPTASEGTVNVKVKRTIKADEWSTLVLPFSMTGEQMKEAFGEDVKLTDFTGCTFEYADDEAEYPSEINITLKDINVSDGMEENHPYVIRTSNDIEEFIVKDVIVDPDEEPCVKTGTRREGFNYLYGTYVAQTIVPAENLFLSGNHFWYSVGKTKMKAYRAYFDLSNVLDSYYTGTTSDAKIHFSVDDSTTGISNLPTENVSDGRIYTLDGRCVGTDNWVKLPQGVYITNGKKLYKK